MEIRDIAIKMAKLEFSLRELQKAGTQSKTWAAIGQQHGVNILNHMRDLRIELEEMRNTMHDFGVPVTVLREDDIAILKRLSEREGVSPAIAMVLKEIIKMWK